MDKTEEKLEQWCSAQGIQFKDAEAEEAYKKRTRRLADAIQLKVPDRVPIAPLVTFFGANYVGLSPEEAMYDLDKAYAAYKQTALDFEWDTAFSHMIAFWGPWFEAFDYKQLKWPGHGVPSNRTYQFVEGEYMKADEYDAVLKDPSDFLIRTYLPRVSGAMAPLQMLPPIRMVIPYYLGLMFMFGVAGAMGTAGVLESLVKAIAEFAKYSASTAAFGQELASLGFPSILGGMTQAPFDTIGDSLRGTQGIMLDMYRQPDKLQKALDLILPDAIQMGLISASISPSPTVFIPLHKGPMGFMSLEQFKTFYWPTLHKLMLALIDEGLIPMPFIEADYTDRLEIIADIPKGKGHLLVRAQRRLQGQGSTRRPGVHQGQRALGLALHRHSRRSEGLLQEAHRRGGQGRRPYRRRRHRDSRRGETGECTRHDRLRQGVRRVPLVEGRAMRISGSPLRRGRYEAERARRG